MDALQAATSAFALAELARQTALLMRRVYRAHKDAEELYQKTQNLSRLSKNVARILERRERRRQNGLVLEDNKELEDNIVSSLDLCDVCLRGIQERLNPLVERSPTQSNLQLRSRFRFILQQGYIQSQERNIGMHLSTLSVLLSCLQHEDQAEQQAREQRHRQQSIRDTQEMHADVLQRLFVFFQYVFHRAAAESSSTGDSRMANAEGHTEQARRFLAIEDVGQQPILQDIFSTPNLTESPILVEELFTDDDSGVDMEAMNLGPDEPDVEDLAQIDRSKSMDMTYYASETTFLLAIKQGLPGLVRSLLDDRADTKAKDSHNWTLLHHAVFCCHQEIVRILLKHEKSECGTESVLNAQTKTGETALILAAQRVNKEDGYYIAQMLLEESNCDINISDGRGSAFYYAAVQGNPKSAPRREIVEVMAGRGADVQAVYEQDRDILTKYNFLSKYIQTEDTQNLTTTRSRRRSSAAERGNGRNSFLGGMTRRLTGPFRRNSNGQEPES